MKILLNLVWITFMLSATVDAQHVNLGIKAGLNLYNVSSDDNSEYDSKAGIHVGLIGHVHLKDHFALQPEIIYSVQGAKSSEANSDDKINLGYINIPVLFQYMFDNGFRIQAGPQLGILVNAKAESNNISIDIKDDLKAIEFAIAAGLSYVHPPTGFGVDVRYNIGLTNINDTDIVKVKNNGLQIGVFYLLKHRN
ncbi:MAG: PorT family protein [Saprospiraceae bacterium]|nr:PorT family protein [Saprospiraceae bacterium]